MEEVAHAIDAGYAKRMEHSRRALIDREMVADGWPHETSNVVSIHLTTLSAWIVKDSPVDRGVFCCSQLLCKKIIEPCEGDSI